MPSWLTGRAAPLVGALSVLAALAIGAPAAAQPSRSPGRVDVSFDDTPLVEVVRYVARVTGRRFVLTGAVRDVRVTIVSGRPVTPAQLYDGLIAALAAHGLTIVRSGAYDHVVPAEGVEGRPVPVETDATTAPPSERFRLHALRVRGEAAEDTAALLRNFSSPGGAIVVDARTNTLLVTDTDANVRRMLTLLAHLRRPETDERVRVERLRHADAESLAATLSATTPRGASRVQP